MPGKARIALLNHSPMDEVGRDMTVTFFEDSRSIAIQSLGTLGHRRQYAYLLPYQTVDMKRVHTQSQVAYETTSPQVESSLVLRYVCYDVLERPHPSPDTSGDFILSPVATGES